ncbi:MAG TPA: UDP-N-acetylglucosamine 2-epimerase [Bacteroidia bacterium]|nr:UDP-N-acetylglucosamine 2-epimerase [Bacteroidia bacterium]
MKKKILAITGIRSEYDILYPILKQIESDNDFDLKLVVSSAHLSEWHNFTLKKIEEDGFTIADKIDCLFMTNRNVQRSKGVGMLTYALSQTVEREAPDFLLVVGDREESIATALVGNYMNIAVAHLGGGDPVFGNADDPIRMAVSKLAHIHFVTAKEYGNNLKLNLKEDDFRIFFCGNPALTNVKNTVYKTLDEISDYLHFDIRNGKYLVLIKHPLSSEEANDRRASRRGRRRRFHRAGRGERRRHPREGARLGAHGARPPDTDRAADRRDGRRRLGQEHRDQGPHAAPRL